MAGLSAGGTNVFVTLDARLFAYAKHCSVRERCSKPSLRSRQTTARRDRGSRRSNMTENQQPASLQELLDFTPNFVDHL